MRILAIETATPACSVALFDGDELLAGDYRELGRGHAEQLVPMIGALPAKGRAQRILVSLGPGSFTGVRIGIAAARALGVAWQAEVLGYPTLALVAAMARGQMGAVPCGVAMSGGHGEWFCQQFDASGRPASALASLPPDQAAEAMATALVAGSQAQALVGRRGHGEALSLLPDARKAQLLDSSALSPDLSPHYGRAPDARPAHEGTP